MINNTRYGVVIPCFYTLLVFPISFLFVGIERNPPASQREEVSGLIDLIHLVESDLLSSNEDNTYEQQMLIERLCSNQSLKLTNTCWDDFAHQLLQSLVIPRWISI